MRNRTLLLAALSAATTVALHVAVPVAAAAEPVLKGDLARLQGQWTAMFGPQKDIPLVVTIEGTSATIAITTPDGQRHESKGAIKIDEAAKPYKTLDWIKFTRPDGETAPENLGIYRLHGDELTICNGGPGNERPTEFRAGEGGPPQLIVLTRKTDPATAGDRARIQGRWTTKVGRQKDVTVVLTIEGTAATLAFRRPDGSARESKGEIKIDEDARPHKTLDWVNFTNARGEVVPTNPAIYKLDGDTLTICSGGMGKERPTEFRAGDGGRPSLIVLTRE